MHPGHHIMLANCCTLLMEVAFVHSLGNYTKLFTVMLFSETVDKD